MAVSKTTCEVVVTDAMARDDGQWDFFVGTGADLTVLERTHHLYTVVVNGKMQNKSMRYFI